MVVKPKPQNWGVSLVDWLLLLDLDLSAIGFVQHSILPHLEIDLLNKLKFYEDKMNRMQKDAWVEIKVDCSSVRRICDSEQLYPPTPEGSTEVAITLHCKTKNTVITVEPLYNRHPWDPKFCPL